MWIKLSEVLFNYTVTPLKWGFIITGRVFVMFLNCTLILLTIGYLHFLCFFIGLFFNIFFFFFLLWVIFTVFTFGCLFWKYIMIILLCFT